MKSFIKAIVIITVLWGVLYPASAGAQPWLSEDDRLKRGDVIISYKEAPDTLVHEVQAEIIYETGPEMVWTILTDYNSYERIFPDIESVEVVKRNARGATLKIRIDNLWPSPDFIYTISISEDPAQKVLTWKMVEGNLKILYGSCSLEALPGETVMTKATYRLTRDPGWFVPGFSSDLTNRSIVIERLLALRKEIRDRKKILEPGEDDSEIRPKWRKALFWWEKEENPEDNENKKPKDEASDKDEKK